MYSASPHLIKHYVPLAFSKQSIDYNGSSHKTSVNPIDQNPLMNMKLRKIDNKPKDFVLIFKNKSCKEFSPRKKVNYQPLIKEISNAKRRNSHQIVHQYPQKYVNQNQEVIFSNIKLNQPRQISTSYQTNRSPAINQKSYRNIKTPSTFRKTFNSYNTMKEDLINEAKRWRSGKIISSAKKKQIVRNLSNFQPKQQEEKRKFKISGKKAPQSETTDHFKKYLIEPHFSIINKIIN